MNKDVKCYKCNGLVFTMSYNDDDFNTIFTCKCVNCNLIWDIYEE